MALERILHAQFQDPVSYMVGGLTKCGRLVASRATTSRRATRPCNCLTQIIQGKLQISISIRERQQVMVQEIEGCKSELYTLPFGEFEVLEQRQVTIPKH